LEKGVEEIVLGRGQLGRMGVGQLGRMGVAAETEKFLRGQGISYHIEKTKKAIELFNKLAREGKRVGGVFHSTC